MLSEIFKALFITSLAGSCLAAVIAFTKPITKKIFGYSWHYYIWLCVLFVMILPVRFNVKTPQAPSISTQTVQTEQTVTDKQPKTDENVVQADTAQKPQVLQKATVIWDRIMYNRMNILAYLWLAGMAVLLLIYSICYIRLICKMHKNSAVVSCPELTNFTDKRVTVRVWENTSTPFMVGVFKPTLVLPDGELTEEQLDNIIRHEMTHFKRHDILYKWFAELVKCVHWFNPVIWYVSKQINTECEISCDIAVTKNMSDTEEMSYINTILSLLPKDKSNYLSFTTQMASGKKVLKRRFTMIKNKKQTSKFISVLSAVIAVIMLSTTVFASGVLSDMTTDNYTIEILNNGEKIELKNKPFIENGEVYVPLRELMQKLEIGNEKSIVWDNGKISLYLDDHVDFYTIEIGEKAIKYNSNEIITNSAATRDVENPPILSNDTTFIPYEYVDYIFNRFDNYYKIDYFIYDKNGENATDTLELEQELSEMVDPFRTSELFFKSFYNQDFEKMKRYCTQNCIDNFFGNDYVFGMKKATLKSIGTVSEAKEKGFTNGEWVAQAKVKMIPDENSVFDPNQTETSFYMILKLQNGRYLIDEFATGL